jgi:hypothetical protein
VTGGRPSANAFRIDGTTNTDPSFNTYIVNLRPTPSASFQIEPRAIRRNSARRAQGQ